MSTDEETKTAIQELNGHEFMGNKISVELSHSKVRQKPGIYSYNQAILISPKQCFQCASSFCNLTYTLFVK